MRKICKPPVSINRITRRIGHRIFEQRTKMGVSQRYVAKLSGLSVGFVCDVENGKRGISVVRLLRVAEVFGCTLNDLVKSQAPERPA